MLSGKSPLAHLHIKPVHIIEGLNYLFYVLLNHDELDADSSFNLTVYLLHIYGFALPGLVDAAEMCLLSPFSSQSEADLSLPLLISSSPGPNKSCCFQREPPEGCEKVKVWEETRYTFICWSCQRFMCELLISSL